MKKITLYILTAAGILLFDLCMLVFAKVCISGLHESMPEIALFDRQILSGPVVPIESLCEWDNIPRMYITSANWQDGDPELPVISDDQQTVFVGEKCGVLEVTVSSSPDVILPANTVTVTVEQQP